MEIQTNKCKKKKQLKSQHFERRKTWILINQNDRRTQYGGKKLFDIAIKKTWPLKHKYGHQKQRSVCTRKKSK